MALERCQIEKGRRGSSAKEETGLSPPRRRREATTRTSILASAFVHSLKNQPTAAAEMPVRPQSEVNEVERTYTLIQYTLRAATRILYTVVLTEKVALELARATIGSIATLVVELSHRSFTAQ